MGQNVRRNRRDSSSNSQQIPRQNVSRLSAGMSGIFSPHFRGRGGGVICGDIRSLFQPAFPLAGGPGRAGSGERRQLGSHFRSQHIIEDGQDPLLPVETSGLGCLVPCLTAHASIDDADLSGGCLRLHLVTSISNVIIRMANATIA